jgi:hypothetical protein
MVVAGETVSHCPGTLVECQVAVGIRQLRELARSVYSKKNERGQQAGADLRLNCSKSRETWWFHCHFLRSVADGGGLLLKDTNAASRFGSMRYRTDAPRDASIHFLLRIRARSQDRIYVKKTNSEKESLRGDWSTRPIAWNRLEPSA